MKEYQNIWDILETEIYHATGHHFNLPGRSKKNLKATVLGKVKKHDIIYRKEREA